jgi:uncharacterized protein (TIGR02001 family)
MTKARKSLFTGDREEVMIGSMQGRIILMMASSAALLPSAAHAGDDAAEKPVVAAAYNVAIVSDYRFRGLSLSNRKPAVQAGIDLAFRNGIYLGTWTSNVASTGGSNIEVDLYGGYGGSFLGFDYTAGALGYVYPGSHGVNYVELQSTVGRTIGPVKATLTAAWTPKQGNAVENLYLSLGGKVALAKRLSASASVGRENGGFDHKYDWSAGLAYAIDALEISALYVDTNYKSELEAGRNGRAGAVLSAKVTF